MSPNWSKLAALARKLALSILQVIWCIVVSKIDENRCKKNTDEFSLISGVHVVSVYSYIEPTTDYCICSE